MNLYLDDDSAKAKLKALLRQAGHRVVIPADGATFLTVRRINGSGLYGLNFKFRLFV